MLGMAIRKWWVRLTRESSMIAIVNPAPVRHKCRQDSDLDFRGRLRGSPAAASSGPSHRLTPNPDCGRSKEGPHSPGVRMSSLPARRTRVAASFALFVALAAGSPSARAFCGFYVGKADAKLFNEASQVILARDGDRTVISM